MAEPKRPGWLDRWVASNMPSREQLAESRWIKPFGQRVLHSEFWRFTRRSVPRGVAMGLFVGVFFLIPGVQIIGAALFCVPVRGNIPIAAGMTFLTNPFTTPFLILASIPVGNLFGFHADTAAIIEHVRAQRAGSANGWPGSPRTRRRRWSPACSSSPSRAALIGYLALDPRLALVDRAANGGGGRSGPPPPIDRRAAAAIAPSHTHRPGTAPMRKLLLLAAATALAAFAVTAVAAGEQAAQPAAKAAAAAAAADRQLRLRHRRHGPQRRARRRASTITPTAIGTGPPKSPPTAPITACSPCSPIFPQTRTRDILDEAARRPGSRIGDFYASFMDEAAVNARRHRAAPADARAGSRRSPSRADWAAAGRPAVPPGRHRAVQRLSSNSDERNPDEMIAAADPGRPRPARPRLLSERRRRPRREAHRLSGLSRPAADPGRRGQRRRARRRRGRASSAASPRCTGPASRIATTRRPTTRWALADFAAQRAGLRLGPLFRRDRPCRPAEHPGLAAERLHRHAPGSSARRRCRCSRTICCCALVDNAAPFLSQPFVDANFAFRGTVLNGTPQNAGAAGSAASTFVTSAIPDDVSRIYVERYFPPEAKARGRRAGPQRHRGDGPPARQPRPGWRRRRGRGRAPSSPPSPPRSAIPTAGAIIRASRISRDDLLGNVMRADRVRISAQPRQARPARSTAANGA